MSRQYFLGVVLGFILNCLLIWVTLSSSVVKIPVDYVLKFYKIKEHCGHLCEFGEEVNEVIEIQENPEGDASIKNFVIKEKKEIICEKLFDENAQVLYDGPEDEWPSPSEVPVVDEFTMHGVASVKTWAVGRSEEWPSEWSSTQLSDMLRRIQEGNLNGNHGKEFTKLILDYLQKENLKGKRILVIGTPKPWLEITCLAAGADSVTSLVAKPVVCSYPGIECITQTQINSMTSSFMEHFDIAISFNTLAQDGLGRNGKTLNPYGDVISVARLSCLVKKGGHLILGLPTNLNGNDVLLYNAGRQYGVNRWKYILTNWKIKRSQWIRPENRSPRDLIVTAVNERV